jgi:hypothetical protein
LDAISRTPSLHRHRPAIAVVIARCYRMDTTIEGSLFPARHWHALADGRIQCDVCPRFCRLYEGQRGLCFVRVW